MMGKKREGQKQQKDKQGNDGGVFIIADGTAHATTLVTILETRCEFCHFAKSIDFISRGHCNPKITLKYITQHDEDQTNMQ